MGTNRRCIVFDMDDTLYLERDFARSGFAAVGAFTARELGIQRFAESCWAEFRAQRYLRIFDRVLRSNDVEPTRSLVSTLVDIYRSHEPALSLLPDARQCLDRLAGKVELGLISDGPLGTQQAKLRSLGLDRREVNVLLTAALGPGFSKPHQRPFEILEQQSECHGDRYTYVADNPIKDFVAPRALGWRTVRVRRKSGIHYAVPNGSDVDIEVPDLSLKSIDFLSGVSAATR